MTQARIAPSWWPAAVRFGRLYAAGLLWGPLLFLAPCGALLWIGADAIAEPLLPWAFWAMLVFPLVPATLLFKRTAGEADPGATVTERLEAAAGKAGGAVVGIIGSLLALGVAAFLIAGVVGLLWFGVKQLF